MLQLLTRVFGSRNERIVRSYGKLVGQATAFEPAMQGLSDEQLGAKTAEFRERLKGGATLDQLLPEAFAVVREAAVRTLKMRHFDVQLVGGMTLHQGRISEMRTGEGKTLVATLPAYLNALSGEGVHVVTVNEYLASRDAEWMSPVFRILGMTVGVIRSQQDQAEKRAAYACDITYGTNNEFGFDYLRDNLAYRLEDRVQRGLVVRHRRRGRFHPHRRGAHAADHFRSRRRRHGTLPRASTSWCHRWCGRRKWTGRAISRSTRRPSRSISPRPATSASSS